ncbi:MAG: hypothetical protein Q8M22_00840 [Actinomycetota bacterium]|nr:hypothetical protein [Actinomycetota bacterium]
MSDTAAANPEERAAMRAFLQRCEVRLSTMHRVATALLSGAGILVLLPAVERDAVLEVLRSLLAGPVSWSRGLLAVAVSLSIALALVVLWLVIIELTRFYFHANHVVHADGEVFTPRFTLTGLRFPTDEFDDATNAAYVDVHQAERTVRLLVPGNERARARIDRQLDAYPGLVDGDANPDRARAQALFELAAAHRRTLVEEVAKVEYGIVRHMLRLQVIVLRYVKALLVIVVTSLAAFAAAAAVNGQPTISAADERWIAGTMALWAPVVLLVVSSPVRWLETLLRTEGAQHTAVSRDHELTQLEEVTARIASVAWVVSVAAMILLLVHHPISRQGGIAVFAALAVSSGLFIVLLLRFLAVRRDRRRPARAPA